MSSRVSDRPLRVFWRFAAVALLATPALAGELVPSGDGSDTNNRDLLRDATTGCENCAYPPTEWTAPAFDPDWRLTLRGAYVNTDTGAYLQAIAAPALTFTHDFLRGSYAVTADAEIIRSSIEDFRLGALRAGIAGDYQLDQSTRLAATASFSLTRDSAATIGAPPTVLRKPLTLSGSLAGSISRDFGPLVVTARADANRTMYEPTLLVGPVVQDNGHLNNWLAGAGLRLGYRVTPVLTAFVDGSAAYQAYDAASPTYLVKLDGYDLEGRVGLSGEWGNVWTAEAAVGYGLRRFVDPSLPAAGTILYDASVTFRPTDTVELAAALATSFDAPGVDTVGYARLEHALSADLRYRVNPWLTLRASAGASTAQLVGTPETERRTNAGVGADYLLNEHTTLSADYAYAWKEKTPTPAETEHRVTLGITYSR